MVGIDRARQRRPAELADQPARAAPPAERKTAPAPHTSLLRSAPGYAYAPPVEFTTIGRSTMSTTVTQVSLVRVDTTWHVFTSTQYAWAFYDEWREYRDCEFIGEIPVDVDMLTEDEQV